MSTRQYKNLKGLKKENLRDNMSTLELALNMLAEATTTELTKAEDPDGLEENLQVANAGGTVAGNARKEITITKFKGIMKPIRLFNPVLSLLAFPTFKKENEPYDYPILSFLLSRDDNEEYYKILFHRIKKEIGKNHKIFAVGLTRDHPVASVMKNLPKITGESTIYEVRFSGQKEESISFDTEHIATEFALF